jgi:hypothetical protein
VGLLKWHIIFCGRLDADHVLKRDSMIRKKIVIIFGSTAREWSCSLMWLIGANKGEKALLPRSRRTDPRPPNTIQCRDVNSPVVRPGVSPMGTVQQGVLQYSRSGTNTKCTSPRPAGSLCSVISEDAARNMAMAWQFFERISKSMANDESHLRWADGANLGARMRSPS